MMKYALIRIAALAGCVGMLFACTAPQTPFRVGLLEWPPYELTRLAAQHDLFGDLEVQFVEFQSPAEAARAYAVGGLDVVALTLDYAIELGARDPDHRAFLIIDESLGGDAVISRNPLPSLADIAGQRIGVESSELGSHMLSRLLERAGLTLNDVEMIFVDIPDQVRAWNEGAVDIMITYEPMRTLLLERGGHQIFSSAEIPGEIVDIFLARQSSMDAQPSRFRAFARGWFGAIEQWQRDPQAAAEALAPRLQLTPEQFITAIGGVRLISLAENRELLGDNNDAFVASIGRFVETLALGHVSMLPDEIRVLLSDTALPAPGATAP